MFKKKIHIESAINKMIDDINYIKLTSYYLKKVKK